MDPVELTAAITALANALSCRLTVKELNLLGMIFNQLGATIITIAAERAITENSEGSLL